MIAKNIQKTKLQSSLLYYPYNVENKTVSYKVNKKEYLINLIYSELVDIIKQDDIFVQNDT